MTPDSRRQRSGQTIAYTAFTLLIAVLALVMLATELSARDASVLDVLLWAAISALLLASAAHQWWFAGRAANRSLDIVEEISHDEVDAIARASDGEVDSIRRLRVAHPGLGLRDAYELMQAHKRGDGHEAARPRESA